MGVNSNQYLQGINVTTGTGAPTHSAVAGDRYTDTATGNTYQYTTSWQTVSYSAGGLTYFTEAQNTSAPNATVPVDSLTAVSGATNADFAIRPKGTGAILAQVPDSSFSGNKRGQYALDFQRPPNNSGDPTRVASGNYSVILSGTYNTASGANSSVLNADSSYAGAGYSTIVSGYQNSSTGGYSFIGNGQANTANTVYATVINGYSNIASGSYSITGGISNTASGTRAVAFGDGNIASGYASVALNNGNTASSDYSNARGISAYTFTTYTKWALSCGGYGLGASQKGLLVLNNRTTGNTPTELAVFAQVSDARNQMTCQDNTGMRVKGSIIGKQSGSTNIAAWDFDYIIVRGVGVGTTTVVVANVNVVSNIPAWGTPTITADTGRGYASIKVTGATATNIQWTATLDSCEVIYA